MPRRENAAKRAGDFPDSQIAGSRRGHPFGNAVSGESRVMPFRREASFGKAAIYPPGDCRASAECRFFRRRSEK